MELNGRKRAYETASSVSAQVPPYGAPSLPSYGETSPHSYKAPTAPTAPTKYQPLHTRFTTTPPPLYRTPSPYTYSSRAFPETKPSDFEPDLSTLDIPPFKKSRHDEALANSGSSATWGNTSLISRRAVKETAPQDFVASLPEYSYDPLQQGEIRLLRFSPNALDAVRVEIFACRLDEAPAYTALSYVWGDRACPERITVNQKSMHIRSSLGEILRYPRLRSLGEIFWVDALCVDQNSTADKNQQVPLMGDIYQKARQVCAWLGPGDFDSDLAIDFCQKLLKPGFLREIKDKWSTGYGFIALGRLLERTWFSRRWVVQEVAYAKHFKFLCGDREIDSKDFQDAVSIVQANLEGIQASFQDCRYYRSQTDPLRNFSRSGATALLDVVEKVFLRTAESRVLGRKIPLETLLCELTAFDSTDARDIVFALAGLAKDWAHPLKVDYEKSVLDVYTATISHCIAESNSLDIICRPWAPLKRSAWRRNLPDPDLIFQVPSWMSVSSELPFGDPMLQSISRTSSDPLVGVPHNSIYHASDSDLTRTPRVKFEVDDIDRSYNGSLLAKGIILATITDVSTRMADGIVLKECLEMLGYNESSKVHDLDPSVWRVLCANRGEAGKKMPATYRHALSDILQKLPTDTSIDTIELLATLSKTEGYVGEYLRRMQAVVWNQRVLWADMTSDAGEPAQLVGIAPREAKAGDVIAILFGGSVPFVFREHEEEMERYFELVGAAYVDGYMEGEAVSGLSTAELKRRTENFRIW